MKQSFYIVFAAIVLASCGSNPDNPEREIPKDTVLNKIDSAMRMADTVPQSRIDTLMMEQRDTTLKVTDNVIYIKGFIKPEGEHPVYKLEGKAGDSVVVLIKPLEKNGNVRISQLEYPDRKMDGPFGDSVSYRFKQKGILSVIVGENMMAGDRWKGYFVVQVHKS